MNPVATTLFDPAQGYGALSNIKTLVDCSVVRRRAPSGERSAERWDERSAERWDERSAERWDERSAERWDERSAERWEMFIGGIDQKFWDIQIFRAVLPVGAPLSATGWRIDPAPDDPASPAPVAGKTRSYAWDGKGGRHCVSYARGWDAERQAWIERLYYAGAPESYLGPYAIGYLEWDGAAWQDQPAPCFVATEPWERGSVYEPNVLYHDGLWRLWYVAGSNQEDYLVHGYAESANGRDGWSPRRVVFAPEEKVFDFAVIPAGGAGGGFEAVFSRVNLSGQERPQTGLWWCSAPAPFPDPRLWSEPVRLTGAGPWKPAPAYGENGRLFVFHDGLRPSPTPGMPQFLLQCLEVDRPAGLYLVSGR